MATKTNIRWQQRVDRPYEQVEEALNRDATAIFRQATATAETRAKDAVADLHTTIAGLELHQDILIHVNSYTEIENEHGKRLMVDLEWKAAKSAYLFPVMAAKLTVSPHKSETLLDFRGEYEPPLGFLGKAIDNMVGQRVAEACVEHFMEEVAAYLHSQIVAA